MEAIITFFKTNPLVFYIILGAVGAGLLTAVIMILLLGRRFSKLLQTAVADPERGYEALKRKYSRGALLTRSRMIEAFANKYGTEIVRITGIDKVWIDLLMKIKNKKNMTRVLKYAPEKGLFKAFLVCLDHRGLNSLLLKWLAKSSDLLAVRKIAMAGRGEEFDGRKALGMFRDQLDEIREMAGDPEWASRYFAVKILLHDRNERTLRLLWEGLEDPHPLVRKCLVNEFKPGDREQIYGILFNLFTKDPVYEVREAAARRIYKFFADFHMAKMESLDFNSLEDEEVYHILELLRPGSKNDENLALRFLSDKQLEIRFVAASYLEKCGALSRLVLKADMGDQKGISRILKLLKCAHSVNNISFLDCLDSTENPGSLMICADILKLNKSPGHIETLAEQTFSIFKGNPEHDEVYRRTLECISESGTENAIGMMDRELWKWYREERIVSMILDNIPARKGYIFSKTLLKLLETPDFFAGDRVVEILGSFESYLLLPELLRIVKGSRKDFPHKVRIRAFKLLGKLGHNYCIQLLLENLPVLTPAEAIEFTKVMLEAFGEDALRTKAEKLLASVDCKIRAALVSALPATGNKDFLPEIRKALKDADPDVRIASAWALAAYDDTRSLAGAVSLLRDPLERVRREAAMAVGSHGADSSLVKLKEVLIHPDEITDVKRAAIEGLGQSGNVKSIAILLEYAASAEELRPEVITAIAGKSSKQEVIQLIEEFKNAEPGLRPLVCDIFKKMGVKGEQQVIILLKEEIRSLKPYITEILGSTGGVEAINRRLKHRDPAVRREAAELLSYVGTLPAFRGMVLAARDPDEEVRIKVVKALEKLETGEGKKILEALLHDPDDKVRKYTHWAIERLKAKAL